MSGLFIPTSEVVKAGRILRKISKNILQSQTNSGRAEVQNQNLYKCSHLQLTGSGHFIPSGSGHVHWLMYLYPFPC